MLRFVILLILFLIFSVWIGIQLEQDPGMAIFMWQGNSIEMPLWFAAILFLVGLFLMWQVFIISKSVPLALDRLRRWRTDKQTSRETCNTREGLLSLLEYRWADATYSLQQKETLKELDTLTTIGAAYASHKLGDFSKRDAIIAEADETLATQLVKADFALEDNKPGLALKTLLQYRHIPAAQLRLQQAYSKLREWEKLLEILTVLQKTKMLSVDQSTEQSIKAAKSWLLTANDLDTMQSIWRKLPRHLQKSPNVVYVFVSQLIKYPNTAHAAAIHISSHLKNNFDRDLVKLYGQVQQENPLKQLSIAEKWLQNHPQDINLLLTLTRIAIHCKLWGKARNWINEALMLDATNTQALALLGRLEELTDNPKNALTYYSSCLQMIYAKNITSSE